MRAFPPNLLTEALKESVTSFRYELSRRIACLRPGRAVLTTETHVFDINEAITTGVVSGRLETSIHSQISVRFDDSEPELEELTWQAVFAVQHRGEDYEVLVVTHPVGDSMETVTFVVGPSDEANRAFFRFVCEKLSEVSGEILVFESGSWQKDERLFAAIRKSSLASLVLRGTLKEEIVRDVTTFFESRATYERYKVPYKRGILLYGPPGNGKTHFLKGLLGSIEAPCLYVKSLIGRHHSDHEALNRIFSRARRAAPCVLVFEDLESILSDHNRSFFLNELDGFAENTGIVVLATTNYPEQIDPAIIDRPSRFDRKYLFDLPSSEERLTFLKLWASTVDPDMVPDEDTLRRVADGAQGFSFAYMKELTTSAIMSWIQLRVAGGMSECLVDVLATLKLEQRKGKTPGGSRSNRRVGLTPEA